MKKYAVIVAGGSGQRMGTDIPKQFLLLRQKPVLWHTLHTFLAAYTDIQIILVLPKDNVSKGEKMVGDLSAGNRILITTGGESRFQSVQNGLALVTEPSVVFVHDGVRCLVTKELIHRCYEQAIVKGSAIPAVMAIDSIRMVDEEDHHVVNRNHVRIIQTPQTFLSKLLLPAFQQLYDENFTDEATVVEASGELVYLIEGDYQNIKITRPLDLVLAENILARRSVL
jgi:2-C-methyl-D-erythritol 4-phosphate cytidylyltransferase